MSVILTGGQSFDQIAAAYTLAPEYGVAIQNYNNMQGQDITGKKFYLNIPDTWMLPQYAGKQIDLTQTSAGGVMSTNGPGGVPAWVYLVGLGALVLFVK